MLSDSLGTLNRRFFPISSHSASPVVAEGRIYYMDDDGITWVVKASDKFEVLEKNAIGEECYASPAFSKGEIFLRGSKHLYCIGRSR